MSTLRNPLSAFYTDHWELEGCCLKWVHRLIGVGLFVIFFFNIRLNAQLPVTCNHVKKIMLNVFWNDFIRHLLLFTCRTLICLLLLDCFIGGYLINLPRTGKELGVHVGECSLNHFHIS